MAIHSLVCPVWWVPTYVRKVPVGNLNHQAKMTTEPIVVESSNM